MTTLVLQHRYLADGSALCRAAAVLGWPVGWFEGSVDQERFDDPVFYGETPSAHRIAGALGIVLLEPRIDWLSSLPWCWTRRRVVLTTLGHARQLRSRAFIKPVDEKVFRASVYASPPSIDPALRDDLPVLIQEPVRFEVEYRVFMLERRPVTASIYMRLGEVARAWNRSWPSSVCELRCAMRFAAALAQDPVVTLPPGVVVDVGRLVDGTWAVVEANAPWGAGLYGCEPFQVLPVLQRVSVATSAVGRDDLAWARSSTLAPSLPRRAARRMRVAQEQRSRLETR